MDASGLSTYSALPLFPLAAVLWYLDRRPRQSMGLVSGRLRDYGLAILYPICVIGALAAISVASGAADASKTDWSKACLNTAIIAVSTFVVAILTEEGFFRGWLWAALENTGMRPDRILIATSVAFALWHLSAVTLQTGFNPPRAQVPVFMVNAAVVGASWGLLRRISGSVIVSSASHGLWNGLAYALFGFGARVGALGVRNTGVFGPEVGVLGLVLNVVYVAILWRRVRTREDAAPGPLSQAR